MKNIAIFASGRGSNFKAIYSNIKQGNLPARIACLITDHERASAIDFAQQNDIPFHIFSPRDFQSSPEYGDAMLAKMRQHQVHWIVLAGFLKKIPDNVVDQYPNKIINIHPALLPSFGGKGMYGINVHRAVYNSGVKVSGVTVHLVNNEYDAGPIVMQQAVNIEECRTPQEIADKLLSVEHQLYSLAIRKLLTIPFHVEGQRVIFQDNTSETGGR